MSLSRSRGTMILGAGLLVAGCLWSLPHYFLSYRPAQSAYDAKASEIEKLRKVQQENAEAWGQIGQIVGEAGQADLARAATGELMRATASRNELDEQLRTSNENRVLDKARDGLRMHRIIAIVLAISGVCVLAWQFWPTPKATVQ